MNFGCDIDRLCMNILHVEYRVEFDFIFCFIVELEYSVPYIAE